MSMTTSTARYRRRLAGLAAFAVLSSLFAIAGVQSASAAACVKQYTVARVSQDKIPPGGTGDATYSFTNTSQNCTSVSIGSIQISFPSGWTVNSATPGTGWTVVGGSPGNQAWLAASSGTAKIANGASRSFTIDVTAPPTASCGLNTVGTRAWVATDFTSSEFNSVNTTINVSCAALAFTAQPATTVKLQAITSAPGNPSGDPVAVQATSDTGDVEGVLVTLTLGTSPSGGALSPTTVTSTTNASGIATFTGMSINKSDEGYTLVATATGFSSATSDAFDVVDTYVDCGGSPCSGGATGGGTTGDIQANTNPKYLTVSILSPGLIDCAGYTEITGTVSWKTDDQGNQIGTITADSSLVKKLRPPDQGAAHFQVCFSPDPGKSFVDRAGNTVTSGQAGLLKDCTSSSDTNCVFFRNKTGAGSAVVRFRVADGKGRI
jgi:hypothetical protein